jgi:hypothetical protein
MKTYLRIGFAFAIILILPSCFGIGAPAPARTQLEVRQMQTFIFDVSDFKLVMKAMMNVFQDEGYNVQNVHLDLGFLTSTKEVDVENQGMRFWTAFFGTPEMRWKKTSIIDATANVSEFGDKTKVRVNFQIKQLDNMGNMITVRQIQESEFYLDFFMKVDKSIFIQKEKL